jgi:hypothetical protein
MSLKLGDLDRRVIFWLLVIVLAIPFIRPLGLPIVTGEQAQKAVDTLKALQPGDVVMFSIPDPGVAGEQGPSYTLAIRWLAERGVKMVFVGIFSPETGPMIEWAIENSQIEEVAEYGKDYVNLGFVPGFELAVANLATSFDETINTDAYGNRREDLELIAGIEDANDFDMWMGVTNIMTIRHWQAPYGTTLVALCSAADAPGFAPYYDAGQFTGLIIGKSGGAEFEYLLDRPGQNIRDLDAISMAQLLTVFFVIVGNIAQLVSREER